MADRTVSLPKLYPAQREILKRSKRNNLLILSRRYGKTTFASRLCKHGALVNANHRVAWSAPTWKLMMETFEVFKKDLRDVISRISREDRRIELINGSVIEFWSSDDIQAGRGRKYHLWVSDESQRQRNLASFIRGSVRPTLADFRGNLWVLGTANGEGTELHQFYQECLADEGWFVAHGTLDQNPYIHPDEIAQMRIDLGPELAAQELDSQWVRLNGIIRLIRKPVWDELYGIKEHAGLKVMAVDASISSDLTAIVSTWYDYVEQAVYTDYDDITLLEPDISGQIDFVKLEEFIWNRWRTGRYSSICYDPYQMVSLAQRLKLKGVRMVEFTQNSMRLKSDGYLRQLMNEGRYHHPDHPQLNDHMEAASVLVKNNTFRIVKGVKTDKIDLTVALSMSCWMLNLGIPTMQTAYHPATGGIYNVPVSPSAVQDSPFQDVKGLTPWRVP